MYAGQYMSEILAWPYSCPAAKRPANVSTTPKVESATRFSQPAGNSFELGRKWSRRWLPIGCLLCSRRAPVRLKTRYLSGRGRGRGGGERGGAKTASRGDEEER